MGGLAKLSTILVLAICSWEIFLMGVALLLTIAARLA